MLEHHIQKSIVYKLAFSAGMRFSELKPDDLDNKLFDYHLKQVIRDRLVEKRGDGLYQLTSEGRRTGVGAIDKHFSELDRAHSVIFLIVRRKPDGSWLLFKRKTHPLLDKIGFIHANPAIGKGVFDSAHDSLIDYGIRATFRYVGSGYFKVFQGSTLESFTHFTALASTDAEGELVNTSKKGEYFWQSDIDAISDELLPTAKTLIESYESGQPFFVEKTFNL